MKEEMGEMRYKSQEERKRVLQAPSANETPWLADASSAPSLVPLPLPCSSLALLLRLLLLLGGSIWRHLLRASAQEPRAVWGATVAALIYMYVCVCRYVYACE